MNIDVDAQLACPCVECLISDEKLLGKTFAYPKEAYTLILDVAIVSFRKRSSEDPKLKPIVVSSKYILDVALDFGRKNFGSLAAITFAELGIRTSRDVGRIVKDLKEINVFNPKEDETDTFEQYDVDFMKEFSAPAPKGVP